MKFLSKRQDQFDYEAERTCLTCDNKFQGKYCGRCGEKILLPEEKSIREVLGGILNAFTFLEGKFIRTLSLIIKNPGKLSKDFAAGIRQPYMKPVSIFFVANFIFFLFPFMTSNSLSTPLQYQSTMLVYGKYAKSIIDSKIVDEQIAFEVLAKRYKTKSDSLAKMLIVIMVLLAAIPLALLNYSSKRYFADHVYLSFELNAYFLFVNMIGLSIFLMMLVAVFDMLQLPPLQISDKFFGFVSPLILLYFIIRGFKTHYGYKWVTATYKSLLMLLSLYIANIIYKGILFYISIRTI
ncbi:DUF3667 domain-containing protein [Chryseotalea sanaruensis]|uniref:DUF3667 domain-containing protein n=1 Tax=Chryseotalea sanaruensis TaxID=2482724 RepID=A0A401U5L5_9BACT|nr:DUF3667 domain-containing protein [Chryseotalea sanaruensis]GCC50130.1 DUF3667 domain-containing protein [Chryseotalea sanaruensis]